MTVSTYQHLNRSLNLFLGSKMVPRNLDLHHKLGIQVNNISLSSEGGDLVPSALVGPMTLYRVLFLFFSFSPALLRYN